MKAILYLDEGSLVVTDIYNLPDRKERETQYEYEKRLVRKFNDSQPAAKHKVVGIHLMRN